MKWDTHSERKKLKAALENSGLPINLSTKGSTVFVSWNKEAVFTTEKKQTLASKPNTTESTVSKVSVRNEESKMNFRVENSIHAYEFINKTPAEPLVSHIRVAP